MAVHTIPSFVAHLTGMMMHMPMAQHSALETAALIVKAEMKRVLGTHDYHWPPLAPSTIARKATGDSPGLETGEMRDSIQHHVGHTGRAGELEADIGSDLDKAIWFELGTARQPPRSFMAQAAIREEQHVVQVIGQHITEFLSTGNINQRII
jgi:hypothetical protein